MTMGLWKPLARAIPAVTAALATSASACSSSETGSLLTGAGGGATTAASGSGGAAQACEPGQQAACACVSGGSGVEVCAADGSGYGSCQGCSSGAGGQGGATTSTGSGGTTSTCAGGPTEIDLHQVTVYSNPPDLADWPVTTSLTEVDFTNDGVHVAFSKQDGAERWPDVIPPGWDGPLQYTLGMVECIDGQWYGSAVIEFWYGLYAEGGNVALDAQVAVNWYYDAVRWGLLAGRQPQLGETIGIFVAAGNLRNITTDDAAQSPVMERSNVVLVPMPDQSGATHSL